MLPSNGAVTRCPPSLHGLPAGAVRPLPRYYEDTPTPAARLVRLGVAGRYHAAPAGSLPPHRGAGGAGREIGFGSPGPIVTRRGGSQVSRVPGEPSWWPARVFDPGRIGHARPLRRADAAPASDKGVGSCDDHQFRGSIAELDHLAVYASQPGSLPSTQDSLPTAGQALSGGIDYPQGSNERFPSCTPTSLPPSPSFARRNVRRSPQLSAFFVFPGPARAPVRLVAGPQPAGPARTL